MALFGRFDAAAVVGYNTAQNFSVTTRDPINGVLFGTASQQQTEISPTFSLQTGLTWTPAWLPACCVRGGYQFDQWYNLGRVASSRGDLNSHGLFLSCEWAY
jgi:hypothetical protein